MHSQTALIRAAENLLDFMSVRAGEDVIITADTGTDQAVTSAIFAMAEKYLVTFDPCRAEAALPRHIGRPLHLAHARQGGAEL